MGKEYEFPLFPHPSPPARGREGGREREKVGEIFSDAAAAAANKNLHLFVKKRRQFFVFRASVRIETRWTPKIRRTRTIFLSTVRPRVNK